MLEISRNRKTESQFSASIGSNLSFIGYLGSYHRAFDALMNNVHQSGISVNLLSQPILFIVRHCLELGLKTNIRWLANYSGLNDPIDNFGHNLEKLFAAFKLHAGAAIERLKKEHDVQVAQGDADDFDRLCKKADELTSLFHQLDSRSDSFRYPVDIRGHDQFECDQTVNLLHVAELFEPTMQLLVYTPSVLGQYTDYVEALAETLEEAYREAVEENYYSS